MCAPQNSSYDWCAVVHSVTVENKIVNFLYNSQHFWSFFNACHLVTSCYEGQLGVFSVAIYYKLLQDSKEDWGHAKRR